jgi:KUP system potassium uptake protein
MQVIGDGILTPAQTVLGAFGALKVKAPGITQSTIAGISIAVLALLFLAQPLGTHRIGSFYAPIMLIWFALNAVVGIHNINAFYPAIFKVSRTS